MHAGDAIWNPLTGEKAMIVESAEETAGARTVADFALEAGGRAAYPVGLAAARVNEPSSAIATK